MVGHAFHTELTDRALRSKIRSGDIAFAGHRLSRIYGLLSCSAGKRMRPTMRVFFETEQEAVSNGLRPCGHCMPQAFRQWRLGSSHGIKGGMEIKNAQPNAQGRNRSLKGSEKA